MSQDEKNTVRNSGTSVSKIMDTEKLFAKRDVQSVMDGLMTTMEYKIREYPREDLLTSNLEDLCEYFEQDAIIEVPSLGIDSAVAHEPREENMMVVSDLTFDANSDLDDNLPQFKHTTLFAWTLPFTGRGHGMFNIRPTKPVPARDAVLTDHAITLGYLRDDLDGNVVKADLMSDITAIQNNLDCLRLDTNAHNASIRDHARQNILRVREEHAKRMEVINAVGFPLKVRDDSTLWQLIPAIRRRMPKPVAMSPEDVVLETAEYQFILDTLTHMATVFEHSPEATGKMEEEHLRWILLVGLNSHYEGKATGETFNGEGKTDILVRVGDQNIFIAECKFWGGPEELLKTISQLLRYVTWRDTKTAIIIFNRRKDFSKVFRSALETIPQHPNFIRMLEGGSNTRFPCLFRNGTDAEKHFFLTVLVFNVPLPGSGNDGGDKAIS